jgi:MFS transporter, PPP family, 3-phenylpropionic acid transporter
MGSELSRFVGLFGSLYLGFGLASPFFPVFLSSREIGPDQIGLVLSLSGAVRLVSGPLVGRLADRIHHVRGVLSAVSFLAAALALSFSTHSPFLILLLISVSYATALAPTTSLADALALRSSRATLTSRGFEYGWVRGSGSAAFVLGSLLSGQLLGTFAPVSALIVQGICLVLAAGAALRVPEIRIPREQRTQNPRLIGLLKNRRFVLLVLAAALVLGSHAMHDSFAMITWQAAHITSPVASVLWSEQVIAEVAVFLYAGPRVLQGVSPLSAMALAAMTAAIRWTVLGQTSSILALACVEPLHGITFALLHLACMRILVSITPATLAGTAQSIYALGIGACSVALTFCSGLLYERVGQAGFFVMASVAAAALFPIWLLARAIALSAFPGSGPGAPGSHTYNSDLGASRAGGAGHR